MSTGHGLRVLVSPDKFKGSLSAAEVAARLAAGLTAAGRSVQQLPLADGGDGSVRAAVAAGFRAMPITVTGPTGRPRSSSLAFDGRTAVVEVADTCGLAALPDGRPDPLGAHSRGLGEAVLAAKELGARRIVLALGGSASTDGGAGLLSALGARFRTSDGTVVTGGGSLARLEDVDLDGLVDLSGVDLVVATDVRNPLLGDRGAAAVYAPQKGATPQQVAELEANLRHLVQVLGPAAGGLATADGAGSAGGLGFAGLLLGGRIASGADYFLDLLDFDNAAAAADLVVTGEGRIDLQTLEGKVVARVARRAAPTPVVAVVGRSDLRPGDADTLGLAAVVDLVGRTDGDPGTDPALTARLLEEVGRTLAVGS